MIILKILYLCHRIPYPPNKGDKIRSYNEIRCLSSRHEIHLLAFCDYTEELRYSADLQKYCRTVTLIPLSHWRQKLRAGFAMLRGNPWSLGYFNHPRMKKAVLKTLNENTLDLIFVYCSSMAPYACRLQHIPKVLDFVDSDALKWKQYSNHKKAPARWLFGYEAVKLSQFERKMIIEFDCSVFVSPSEIASQNMKGLNSKIAFIQNGIDLDFFRPSNSVNETPTVAFTGAMDYYPNIDAVLFFARDIFPKIRAVHPDARFIVIGSNPTDAVRRLGSMPGITVTGTVKDVRPFLSQCQVIVVPLRIAQGIQNKILEALAAGLPVVTTPAAAGELSSVKELPLSVANDPVSFANCVLDYISCAPLPRETADISRSYLRIHYDWETNLLSLDNIINNLLPKD